jgi:hypothetical protein
MQAIAWISLSSTSMRLQNTNRQKMPFKSTLGWINPIEVLLRQKETCVMPSECNCLSSRIWRPILLVLFMSRMLSISSVWSESKETARLHSTTVIIVCYLTVQQGRHRKRWIIMYESKLWRWTEVQGSALLYRTTRNLLLQHARWCEQHRGWGYMCPHKQCTTYSEYSVAFSLLIYR